MKFELRFTPGQDERPVLVRTFFEQKRSDVKGGVANASMRATHAPEPADAFPFCWTAGPQALAVLFLRAYAHDANPP